MKKLYVLVDENLNEKQRWVQGTHAAVQFTLEYPDLWKNGHIVMLKSPDIMWDLEMADSFFREPYYDNKVTAVAKYCSGNRYKKYELL